MIRVILDTTVLVSGLLFHGVPGEILDRAESSFTLVLSPSILEELARTLRKPKFRRRLAEADIEPLMVRLRLVSAQVPGRLVVPVFEPDPDDTHILACAAEAQADYLVTGDQALLELRQYGSTTIVSPRSFLDLLQANREETT